MKHFKNSKKAVSFFWLIGFIVLIFFGTLQIFSFSPQNSNINMAKSFSSLTKDFSVISLKANSQKFFLNQELTNIINSNIKNFPKFLISTNLKGQSNLNNIKNCHIKNQNFNLWYNNLTSFNCGPKISKNVITQFETIFKENLNKNLFSGFSIFNIKDYSLNVTYDSKTGFLNVLTDINYSNYTNFGDIHTSIKTSKSFKIDSYFKMIGKLSNVVENLGILSKQEVPNCINNLPKQNPQNPLLFCINRTFQNQMKSFNSNYKFELEQVKTKQGYYEIEFKIFSLKSKSIILNFGGIYKDNIPFNLVSYSLANLDNAKNVISIYIKKPKFVVSDISHYIIFYSYSNFLQNKNTNKFLNLLKNGEIPTKFISSSTSALGYQASLTYSFSPKSEFTNNIYALTTPTPTSYNKGQFKVNLFQNLNSVNSNNIGSYNFLEQKLLYILVFAVNKNYNYQISGLKIKSIEPKNLLKPLNFKLSNFKISGKVSELTNAVNISLVSKIPNPPKNVLIVIRTSNSKDSILSCIKKKSCFNQIEPFQILKDGVIITSKVTLKTNIDKYSILKSNFNLDVGKKYSVSLIPINSFGKGYTQIGEENYYSLKKSVNNGYSLVSIRSGIRTPFLKTISIIQGIPDPMKSISIQKIITSKNGYQLLWNVNSGFDVTSIKTKVNIYNKKGTLVFSNPEQFQAIDSPNNLNLGPINFKDIGSLVISNIIPVSSTGLYDKNPSSTQSIRI